MLNELTALRELVAMIHGDGGHNGDVQEAIDKVNTLRGIVRELCELILDHKSVGTQHPLHILAVKARDEQGEER